MKLETINVGRIVNAHGIKGEVRVQPRDGDPYFLTEFKTFYIDGKPVTPTTINNYVRLKVMPAPEKRKYYRIHIAYLIMIFTLKQGTSINGIQQLLPVNAPEDEVKAFYTNYIQRLQEISLFYIEQTRAAAQDLLDQPKEAKEEAIEHFIIQSILMSGFSRILAEKLLNLRDADPRQVLELETQGRGGGAARKED